MTNENGTTVPGQDPAQAGEAPVEGKGKGKAVATEQPDTAMDEDDDSSDEDEAGPEPEDDDDDDDAMDEIDLNNVVEGGRRTRGRVIDWAKAAEENPADDDDDDDEDDFQPENKGDKMDED